MHYFIFILVLQWKRHTFGMLWPWLPGLPLTACAGPSGPRTRATSLTGLWNSCLAGLELYLGSQVVFTYFHTQIGGVLAHLTVWSEVQICIWPSWYHCHWLSLAPENPDWFYLFVAGSPGWSRRKGTLNECCCSIHITLSDVFCHFDSVNFSVLRWYKIFASYMKNVTLKIFFAT